MRVAVYILPLLSRVVSNFSPECPVEEVEYCDVEERADGERRDQVARLRLGGQGGSRGRDQAAERRGQREEEGQADDGAQLKRNCISNTNMGE